MHRRPIALVLVCLSFAGCGGGSNSGSISTFPLPGAPIVPSSGKAQAVAVSISIRIPKRQGLAARRRPLYVSQGTQSLALSVNGATPVIANVTPGSPGCTTDQQGDLQCTIAANAPPGNDTFKETLYDQIQPAGATSPQGQPLSQATQSATIVAGRSNTVTITLDGIVAGVTLALPATLPKQGSAATFPLNVTAQDAAGYTIVGDPFVAPITLTVFNSDGSGNVSLSNTEGGSGNSVSMLSPSDTITVKYTGAPLTATIKASANGLPPNGTATATFEPRTGSTTDWATFGFDAQRSAHNPTETALGTGNVGALQLKWTYSLDGPYTTTQPIVATNVNTPLVAGGAYVDLVLVGDHHGGLHAVDVANGKRMWHKTLGVTNLQATNCRDIPDGRFGIGETFALDRAGNRVFVVDGAGRLYAFDLGSGQISSGWPSGGVQVVDNAGFDFVYSGLQYVAAEHRLYVSNGSYCDRPTYYGKVRAVDTQAATVVNTLQLETGSGYGAGLWGPGGMALDTNGSDLFGAVGNGFPEVVAYSDSVIRTNSTLSVSASDNPDTLLKQDGDFGSSLVVYDDANSGTCMAAQRKNGRLYTWNRGSLSRGPTALIQTGNASKNGIDLGTPAYDPTTHMIYLPDSDNGPSPYTNPGLAAFAVTSGCSLRLAWQQQFGPPPSNNGPHPPPITANGVVYSGDGAGNTLYAFDASSGNKLWQHTTGGATFTAPTVVDGRLFAVTWDGKLSAFAL